MWRPLSAAAGFSAVPVVLGATGIAFPPSLLSSHLTNRPAASPFPWQCSMGGCCPWCLQRCTWRKEAACCGSWGGHSVQAEKGCVPEPNAVPVGLGQSCQDCWCWEYCRAPSKVPVSSLYASLIWGPQNESLGFRLTQCHFCTARCDMGKALRPKRGRG